MGIPTDPTDPPYEYGDDCNLLIPDLWAAGECPKYITAIFTGIDLCPDYEGTIADPIPNDIPIVLTQTPENPCQWMEGYDSWNIIFDASLLGQNKSGLSLLNFVFGRFAFIGSNADRTLTSWPNECLCIEGKVGEGGSGRIY